MSADPVGGTDEDERLAFVVDSARLNERMHMMRGMVSRLSDRALGVVTPRAIAHADVEKCYHQYYACGSNGTLYNMEICYEPNGSSYWFASPIGSC